MGKSVLIILGHSKGDVLTYAAYEISEGFRNRGYEVVFLDMAVPDIDEGFLATTRRGYSFVFAFQNFDFGTVNDEGKFIRAMKEPYLGWIVDDFIYHQVRLSMIRKEDNISVLSVDGAMEKVAPVINGDMKKVHFLMHGGFECKTTQVKDIEILYPGHAAVKSELLEKKYQEICIKFPVLKTIIPEVTEYLLKEAPWKDIRSGFTDVLVRYGEAFDDEIQRELMQIGAFEYVDNYIRYYYRKKTLEILLEEGFRVFAVGDGYEELLKKYKTNLTVSGGKDIVVVTELMKRSKIVCNPFPPIFRKGGHERIFSAMLNRAVCLTPYSEFQDESFGEHVLFYKINQRDKLVQDVHRILTEYDGLKDRLDKTYQYAKENHTWKHRGEEIVDLAEQIYCLDE